LKSNLYNKELCDRVRRSIDCKNRYEKGAHEILDRNCFKIFCYGEVTEVMPVATHGKWLKFNAIACKKVLLEENKAV
jgi:hypothetical protein